MALFLVMMVPKEIPDMSSTAGITVQQEESLGNKLNQGMPDMNRMLNNMHLVYERKQSNGGLEI